MNYGRQSLRADARLSAPTDWVETHQWLCHRLIEDNIALNDLPIEEETSIMKTLKSSAYVRAALYCMSCVLLMLIITSPSANAQIKSSELDVLFSYYNEHGVFNGVVLAAENGKVTYKRAFGFADFENKTPLDTNDVFSIASVTKTYTALAIMMLNERGLVSYEDRISDFIPDLPEYTKPITIRHLLTHTSGLVCYTNQSYLTFKLPLVTTQIALDTLISQPGLNFEPGEKYSYSSSNYLLLALIVEKVSGTSYREFLEHNIFDPLGMDHTYAQDESMDTVPGRVNGYAYFWRKVERDLRSREIGPGNIYSTVGDQFLFDQALYTDKLISQTALQVAFDTTDLLDKRTYVYGFGWKIPLDPKNKIVYHNGALGGFRSLLWRDLDNRNSLIILSNNHWMSDISGIITGAQNIMKEEPYSIDRISIQALFLNTWYMNGFGAALRNMRNVIISDPTRYEYSESLVNDLGYYFVNRNWYSKAIAIFEYNLELYPDAFNTYDSMGETYLAAGNNEDAIRCYKKALELNPDCKSSKEALEEMGEL